jgi:excisionase family DNA binding protein
MDRIIVTIDKDWLSVADICEYMDVSAYVVTNQLRAGGLPAVKFGREWRVARQDFEDWINEQRAGSEASSAPAATSKARLLGESFGFSSPETPVGS